MSGSTINQVDVFYRKQIG